MERQVGTSDYARRFLVGGLAVTAGIMVPIALVEWANQSDRPAVAAADVPAPTSTHPELVEPTSTVSSATPSSHSHESGTTPAHTRHIVTSSRAPSPTNVPTIAINIPPVKPVIQHPLAPNCLEPRASSSVERMKSCEKLRTGTIAFVDFGPGKGRPYDAQQVADSVVQGWANATGGFIAPKDVLLPATAAAKAALAKQMGQDALGNACVPVTNEVNSPMAEAAASTMQAELSNYVAVVALGLQSCEVNNQVELGNSNPAAALADIYDVQSASETDSSSPALTSDMARTGMHELGHDEGLGHFGTVSSCPEPATDVLGLATINLNFYFDSSCVYENYGDGKLTYGNIMTNTIGDPNGDPSVLLDPVQLDFLQQTALFPVTSHGVALHRGNAQTIRVGLDGVSYASAPIPQGVNQNKDLADFEQLDFEAITQTDGQGNQEPAIRVVANTTFHPNANATYQTTLEREEVLNVFAIPNGELDFTIGNEQVQVVAQPDQSLQITLSQQP